MNKHHKPHHHHHHHPCPQETPEIQMLQTQHLLSSNFFFPLNRAPQFTLFSLPNSPSLNSFHRPFTTAHHSVAAHSHRTTTTNTEPWLAQVPEESTTNARAPSEEEGPIELPSSTPSIFASSEDPTPLQAATSLLLTGAISVFLFRAVRRRAKRAKELKFRSSGSKKSLKEEAIESLKVMTPQPLDAKSPPTPLQALWGGLTAGVIALILYKFAITVEATLNRQTLSDNFSVNPLNKLSAFWMCVHGCSAIMLDKIANAIIGLPTYLLL